MKKVMKVGLLILVLVMLTACGSNKAAQVESEVQEVDQTDSAVLVEDSSEESEKPEQKREELRVDFAESALQPASQLILGTLMLEDTEYAVDAELAPYLAPYWKLYRSLLESDTTAPEELAALIDEIQEVMNSEQVNQIASLELTQEDLMAYMQESGIMENMRSDGVDGETDEGERPGRPDGMPEGTGPGSGEGRGQGGGADGMDPELLATMQAEREAAGGVRNNDRMIVPLINTLIELLESKIE